MYIKKKKKHIYILYLQVMISLFHAHHLPGFENPRHDVNRKKKNPPNQFSSFASAKSIRILGNFGLRKTKSYLSKLTKNPSIQKHRTQYDYHNTR